MDFDVVIAGAGPVGLLLAGELKAAGVSVLLVERDPDAVQPIKEGEMGGRSLNAPSTFALHHRGLLPTVQREAMWWFDPRPTAPSDEEPDATAAAREQVDEPPAQQREPIFAGHFAGIPLRADLIDPADPDIGSHVHGAGVISIGAFERILRDRAVELGVPIRYEAALTALTADDGGVSVEVGGQTLRVGWLVGADGGRSTVRKVAGFDFPGADAVIASRLVLVDMDEPELLLPGGLHETDGGSYILGGWERRLRPTRLILMEPVEQAQLPADRDVPMTAEEIEQSIKRIVGVDTHVTTIHAASRYADNTRQASTYRRGRVLLVGDAAHVHSPAGGQGMNLGIGDAMNLGWKLAATVRGWAPEGLLDSYTAERHPIGAWVQAWSLAQTALGRLDPQTRALRAVVTDLLDNTPGVMYVLKKISGVAQHYDLPGAHRLVGRMAPDYRLADGTRAAQHSDSGHFNLLQRVDAAISAEHLGVFADRLTLFTLSDTTVGDDNTASSPAAILIRPDGYVAWATDEPAEAVRLELAAHLGAVLPAATESGLPAMH